MSAQATKTIGFIRLAEADQGCLDIDESNDLASALRWLAGEKQDTSSAVPLSRLPRPVSESSRSVSHQSIACPPRIVADLATISSELDEAFQQLTV